MLTGLIVIILRCIQILNHYVVQLKLMQCYMSVISTKKKKKLKTSIQLYNKNSLKMWYLHGIVISPGNTVYYREDRVPDQIPSCFNSIQQILIEYLML